jgi:DNA modification methylase
MSRALTSPDKREQFHCFKCGAATDAFQGTARFEANLCRECYGKREDRRPQTLNDLSGKEWAALSKSVDQFPDKRSPKQREHGAAFPKALARAHIEMYTKKGGLVFDPFVGVGTTVDAADELGRRSVGIDINPQFVDLARQSLPKRTLAKLVCADALDLNKYLDEESVDLLFTSPPYGHLLKVVGGAFAHKWKEHSKLASINNPRPYTDSDRDLGNMAYAQFLDSVEEIMRLSRKCLKTSAYSAWVVKDFRDLKGGRPFVNFHGDIIERGSKAGFTLWDIRIVDQTKHRPLVCLGFPSNNFYLNIGHSYVVVFRNS